MKNTSSADLLAMLAVTGLLMVPIFGVAPVIGIAAVTYLMLGGFAKR